MAQCEKTKRKKKRRVYKKQYLLYSRRCTSDVRACGGVVGEGDGLVTRERERDNPRCEEFLSLFLCVFVFLLLFFKFCFFHIRFFPWVFFFLSFVFFFTRVLFLVLYDVRGRMKYIFFFRFTMRSNACVFLFFRFFCISPFF